MYSFQACIKSARTAAITVKQLISAQTRINIRLLKIRKNYPCRVSSEFIFLPFYFLSFPPVCEGEKCTRIFAEFHSQGAIEISLDAAVI